MAVFDNFTNLYSLSKTLRFELKPEGKTLENMHQHLRYDKALQTFLADQEIEDAYQKLKPLFDKLHEEFINDSLNSDQAKNIDFSEYLTEYRTKRDLQNIEKKLREEIGKTFIEAGGKWKQEKYPKYGWKKGSKIANGSDILLTQDILELIKDLNANDQKIKKIVEETFKSFFTYFSGFNQNRENYYTTKDEKVTAVATRIVHENLPKFCDNLIQFECIVKNKKDGTEERIERKSEYLDAYKYLKKQGRTTQIKDAESGKMIEAYDITEDIFQISHFPSCLSQNGIEEYNRVIGHYNLLINLYNQAKEGEEKNLDKKERIFKRLPQFKILYKQIGCGKKDAPFFKLTHDTKIQAQENKEKYNKPYSVEQILEQAKIAGEKYFQEKSDDEAINTIPEFLNYILEKETDSYDGVYWSKAALNTISNNYFANYHDLKDRLKEAKVLQNAAKGSEEDVEIPEVIELERLFAVLNGIDNWKEEDVFFKKSLTEELKDEEENSKNKKRREIITKSEKPSQALLHLIFSDVREHIDKFLNTSGTVLALSEYKSKESKEIIKAWMDHALTVNQIVKYFLVKENKIKGNPLDSEISNALKTILFEGTIKQFKEDVTVDWFKWYDALRNYLTKKPQDDVKENKLKLNFENSSLLKGWDKDLENQRKSIILRDNNSYYLVILEENSGEVFNDKANLMPINDEEIIEKMYFKQQTNVFRQLPRFGFPYKNNKAKSLILDGFRNFDERKFQERKKRYGLNDELLGIKDEFDLFQGNKNKIDVFQEEKLKKLITYYQKIIGIDYKDIFSVDSILKSNYKELNDLYEDFERTAYELIFEPISKKYVNELVEKGKIYMFKILNKDFSTYIHGRKNLHTIYFQSLFDDPEKNIQLSANAQIFYRKQAIKEQKKKKGYEHKDHIIESKRFTNEKFLFHCPISINAKCMDGISNGKPNPKAVKEVNELVNKEFIENDDIYFLGIDRGEKHLAYYSLVDQDGEIIEQGTLNLPFTDKEGKPRSIKKEKYFYNKKEDKWESKEVDCWNYNDLLEAMSSNRDMARKNWQTIGTIKELKEGYISQVVRKIADLAVEHKAFIVLEALNKGFMRGRQKIEKSAYQKFELALAKKLNFLVNKSVKNGEIGSVTNALQLTPPVNNYGDIENKKQVGIMLYTRANYTSQTDPVTGWRKTIYLKKGSEEGIKEQIIKEFTDIVFDGKDYYFEYIDNNIGKQWKLYSSKDGKSLDRFRGSRGKDKNEWRNERVDVVKILDDVFVNFDKTRSYLSQIVKENVKLEKTSSKPDITAWESLRFAIDVIQQIRNTGEDERDNDFIFSPVRDGNDSHFDSRIYLDHAKEKENITMPSSGDSNGAFNIARKGILMSGHIRVWIKNGKPKYDKNTNDLNLFISEDEWDLYLDSREEWEKQLDKFSSRKAMEQAKKNIYQNP